ncbi:MAG: hypothetical protein M1828_007573 [Chrysothrix sp. TS-e1954]|nr:MAG: hypothetical protein M1828_007573 [Chrysothrix sp. TS-e1954]
MIVPLVIAASLLHLVAAQPHRKYSLARHASPPRSSSHLEHIHRHHHRDLVVVTDVVVDVVATTALDEVVYVNTQGNPLSTSTLRPNAKVPGITSIPSSESSIVAQTPAATGASDPSAPVDAEPKVVPVPASAAAQQASPQKADSPAAQAAPTDKPAPAAAHHSSASTPSPVAVSPQAAPANAYGLQAGSHSHPAHGSPKGTSGLGIVYSPYNADHSCKSQSQVNADFAKINGYGFVRIYGTDCNQVATVGNAAKSKGIKIFAGIYDINEVNQEIAQMITAVHGDWSHIETIGIGNEVVNDQGPSMVGPVVNAIGAARVQLKAAGYKGNVVAVDTFDAIMAHPELCHASDFAAANAHAFFDSDVDASQAGNWALHTAQGVSSACGGKRTMITESGWPSRGSNNGRAHPGPSDQAAAVKSLKSKFTDNLILFSAFNDLWKTNNAGTFGTEQFWGILGDAP